MEMSYLPLILFTALSFTSLAFSGFGGIIIAIALGVFFYPIKTMLPILVPLTLLANSYLFIRYHRFIDKKLLFKTIFPLMILGLLTGIYLFDTMHGDHLKRIFALIVILISSKELYRNIHQRPEPASLSKPRSFIYIFGAGVVQGIFSSGGPLLVYVISKMNLTKAVFRSTLIPVWLVSNTILTTSYIFTDRIDYSTVRLSLMLIPSVIIGLGLGSFLHQRINEKGFKTAINILLLLSGCLMLVVK